MIVMCRIMTTSIIIKLKICVMMVVILFMMIITIISSEYADDHKNCFDHLRVTGFVDESWSSMCCVVSRLVHVDESIDAEELKEWIKDSCVVL